MNLLCSIFVAVAIIVVKVPFFVMKEKKANYTLVANLVSSSLGLLYGAIQTGNSLMPFDVYGFIIGLVFLIASGVFVFLSYAGFPKDNEVFNK